MASVVVVGASLAGVHAAAALRRDGFGGDLVVVDAQPHTPYDRPPLSKELLTGRFGVDDLALRAAADLDVTWRLGVGATALSLSETAGGGTLVFADGSSVDADGVVIATGATARRLPVELAEGTDAARRVGVLRSLDDALWLRSLFDQGIGRLVVVGAGFIGLEVAASARSRGIEVTVIEPAPHPLGRVLGPDAGAAIAAVHRRNGVDLRLGVGVTAIVERGHRAAVQLGEGEVVDGDAIVVGIGVTPDTAWLEGSGLVLDDGVVCDETLLAAPGVVAAGDVLRWPSGRTGRLARIEHWDHAVASGEAAARRLLAGEGPGAAEVFDPVPWFWSDQYDTKIQLVGFADPGAESVVVSGGLDEDRFAIAYGRNGRLTGVLGVNRPRHVAMLRGRVTDGAPFEEAVEFARAL